MKIVVKKQTSEPCLHRECQQARLNVKYLTDALRRATKELEITKAHLDLEREKTIAYLEILESRLGMPSDEQVLQMAADEAAAFQESYFGQPTIPTQPKRKRKSRGQSH